MTPYKEKLEKDKKRLDKLSKLELGWYDSYEGYGQPVPEHLIPLVTDFLENLYSKYSGLKFAICPIPDGGLFIEPSMCIEPSEVLNLEFDIEFYNKHVEVFVYSSAYDTNEILTYEDDVLGYVLKLIDKMT